MGTRQLDCAVSAPLGGRKVAKRSYKTRISTSLLVLEVGRKVQLLGPSKLALLPIAVTGSGGPSPRPSPSERQDTGSVMASYVDT